MTQYLLSVHHGDDVNLPEGVSMPQVMADVAAFNERLSGAGAMVFAGGLLPASSAKVAHYTGEVTDGPAVPGESYMGGFWVIEAADDAAALEWARQAVATGCCRTVEVRPFQGIDG